MSNRIPEAEIEAMRQRCEKSLATEHDCNEYLDANGDCRACGIELQNDSLFASFCRTDLPRLLEERTTLLAIVRGFMTIPAVVQVLGGYHTPDCRCPMCKAHEYLSPLPTPDAVRQPVPVSDNFQRGKEGETK